MNFQESYTKKINKNILIISLLISVLYFVLFIFPNMTGSENLAMVAIFEPDESVPYPYILDMIKPSETIKEALINFAFYDYYFYGFPVFGVSALALLPIKWLGLLQQIPTTMAVLRQVISVLPMILTVWVVVYWRTQFKDYRALMLMLFLFSIPAVIQNNFWWHPDSLAILFAILVLFFLSRDNLRFGKNYYLAAVFCGFSAGTKGIGFYFFLTIFIILLLGVILKKITLQKMIISAFSYIFIMIAAYLFSNPILIYQSVRSRFFQTMFEQSKFLYQGYEVLYQKGFIASLSLLVEFYGRLPFLFSIIGLNIVGLFRKKSKFDHILVLSWTIPLTIMVFFISHFKFQYWLPVYLPLISSISIFLPSNKDFISFISQKKSNKWVLGSKLLVMIIIVFQTINFLNSDIQRYSNRLNREKNSPAIQFYESVKKVLFPYIDQNLKVYHDVRMYLPQTGNWYSEAEFNMLNYSFIQEKDFDILLLMQNRIFDYLNPNLEAIDQEKLDLAREFYHDANFERILEYRFLFRDEFGLIFIREDLEYR